MAHSCPECGQTCYCGSDIDDCLFDDEEDSLACTHYLSPSCDGYENYSDEFDCGDCGMCDSCIAQTKASYEEMEREQAREKGGKET